MIFKVANCLKIRFLCYVKGSSCAKIIICRVNLDMNWTIGQFFLFGTWINLCEHWDWKRYIINLYTSNIKPVTDLLVIWPRSQQVNATFQRKVRWFFFPQMDWFLPLETQGIETQHYTTMDDMWFLRIAEPLDLFDSGYYTWVFFIIVSSFWGLNALDWRDQALHCRGHSSQAGFHPM